MGVSIAMLLPLKKTWAGKLDIAKDYEKTDKRSMKSFNAASSKDKHRFSLTLSDGFMILLGVATRIGHTGVAASSSAGTWIDIGVGRPYLSC